MSETDSLGKVLDAISELRREMREEVVVKAVRAEFSGLRGEIQGETPTAASSTSL